MMNECAIKQCCYYYWVVYLPYTSYRFLADIGIGFCWLACASIWYLWILFHICNSMIAFKTCTQTMIISQKVIVNQSWFINFLLLFKFMYRLVSQKKRKIFKKKISEASWKSAHRQKKIGSFIRMKEKKKKKSIYRGIIFDSDRNTIKLISLFSLLQCERARTTDDRTRVVFFCVCLFFWRWWNN